MVNTAKKRPKKKKMAAQNPRNAPKSSAVPRAVQWSSAVVAATANQVPSVPYSRGNSGQPPFHVVVLATRTEKDETTAYS